MSPAIEPERRRHILALDGLRGLAILGVLALHANYHFGGTFAAGPISGPLAAFLGCGWIGVDLFFALSGFLITGILLDTKGAQHFLKNFYLRRALRIMPLYFAYILFIVIVGHLRPGLLGVPKLAPADTASLALYYFNFRVAFVTQYPMPKVHHFWSLSIEEHFYLIWPFLVLMLPPRKLMWLCMAGALLALAARVAVVMSGAWLEIAYIITPCRLDGLLAGSFIALALRDESVAASVHRWTPTVLLASAAVVAAIFAYQGHFVPFADLRRVTGPTVDSSWTLTLGITALALFFAACLVKTLDAAPTSRGRWLLERPWLVAIGRYSYGMYVLHDIVLAVLLGGIRNTVPSMMTWPDYVAKPLLIVLLLAATYLVAFLSYRLFESRFLALKRYFR